jgi:hypothetical protein
MTTNEERIEIGKLEKTLERWIYYAFKGNSSLRKLYEKAQEIKYKIQDSYPDVYKKNEFPELREALDFLEIDELNDVDMGQESLGKYELYHFMRNLETASVRDLKTQIKMTTNEERKEIGKLEKTLERWFHDTFKGDTSLGTLYEKAQEIKDKIEYSYPDFYKKNEFPELREALNFLEIDEFNYLDLGKECWGKYELYHLMRNLETASVRDLKM